MKAFAYLRTSGITADGFPRQREAVRQYAKEHGIQIVAEFADEAVSGRNDYDARPAMRQMLAEIGEVSTVLIEKLDRLARDLVIQEGIIQKLKERGCDLISTAEPDLLSDDPSRVFIRQVFGAVAQLDRCLVVNKLRAARVRRRANGGRCEGRKPFGSRAGEDAALQLMVRLRGLPASSRTFAPVRQTLVSGDGQADCGACRVSSPATVLRYVALGKIVKCGRETICRAVSKEKAKRIALALNRNVMEREATR